MKIALPLLSVLVALAQSRVIEPHGVNDPETGAWLRSLTPPSRKLDLGSPDSNDKMCPAHKPPMWTLKQGGYDKHAKLVLNSASKTKVRSRQLASRSGFESFYCGPPSKGAEKMNIAYSYHKSQVEETFDEAEISIRFWEPQTGPNYEDGIYPRLLGSTGEIFAGEEYVPELCRDKNVYLYEYPILRGTTCDTKPLLFSDGDFRPGPDRVIVAADKRPAATEEENEDHFRTARIKGCTVATFQDLRHDRPPKVRRNLSPCYLYNIGP